MSSTTKLTKKQRKGLAFRQKKAGKSTDVSPGDIPEQDEPDFDEIESKPPKASKRKRTEDNVEIETKPKKTKLEAGVTQDTPSKEKSKEKQAATRFILFVGRS